MADDLTQREADELLAMPKRRLTDMKHTAMGGQGIMIALASMNRREAFDLGIWKSQAILYKGSYRMKGRSVVILARIDFGGPPHRNPDGVDVPCPHLHLYREGYGDKIATALPADRFKNPADIWLLLDEFMDYCNIIEKPEFERVLF